MTTISEAVTYVKGHGTQNDFVVLTDPAVDLDLTVDFVAAVCDRQRGVGADGMLRVARAVALVRAGVIDELPADVEPDDWFMDYRNADGSIAEMCGNGVRVLAHYLRASGLVDSDEFTVGSRAGARPVVVHSFDELHADVSVQMGPVTMGADATVRIGDDLYPGVAVDVGNPHLACVVPDMSVDDLGAVDFSTGVLLPDDMFPHGANVELLTAPDGGADHLHATMRVFERGVGETRSCGTGLVAAAAAALRSLDRDAGEMVIDVPGGRASITLANGRATLRGPSALVADGRLRAGWYRVD